MRGSSIRLPSRLRVLLSLGLCAGACQAAPGTPASPPPQPVAQRACDAITAYVGAPVGPPTFLQSFEFENHDGEPALKSAAFTYDNALAVIALIACDKLPQALRVGEALRKAAITDPRLRNAYRTGPVKGRPLPNGWWDAKSNRWLEDPYQMGTSTGNVAWAGLALLALDNATGDRRWREAAEQLARWIAHNAGSATGAPGFTGGVDGFDAAPKKLAWKSTEHNIDVAALFQWLARDSSSNDWEQRARQARRFVDSQWDTASGHFFIGTLPNGRENTATSAVDVQMWALLLPNPRPEWQRAIQYAESRYRVAGGFDFNADRDGLWLEGTAQAALVYRLHGTETKADALLRTISGQFSASGYVYATREPRITTGLALGPDSPGADFHYFHRLHLGATAWAALAALGWDPFVAHGRRTE
jgi:hypothetical protein